MRFLLSLLEDTLGLIYPNICITCGGHLPMGVRYICPGCYHNLPRTNYHLERDNAVEQIFWGRVPVKQATAFFHFTKGSKYQKLIHDIKYRGKKELGYELGKAYGGEISESPFLEADLIVPVPLHKRKQRRRGFNQSEWIAKGLAEAFHKPLVTEVLYRSAATQSQTRKSRLERWENVRDAFRIRAIEPFLDKHILLVDDVVTTGATLEACTGVLLSCRNASVSILTLGYAAI